MQHRLPLRVFPATACQFILGSYRGSCCEERKAPPIRPAPSRTQGSFWFPNQDAQRFGRNTNSSDIVSTEYDELGTTSAESKSPAMAAYSHQKMFKPHGSSSCEQERRAILLIGITGSGKSSTANTLCGAQRAFKRSAALTSTTSAASARDYSFGNVKYRVVDTPGLQDTNKVQSESLEEIRAASRHAPHGFACVFVVVPKTRLTAEQTQGVELALDFLGADALPYTVMIVTHCRDPREKLLDEINGLPRNNGLRRLALLLDDRVIPVENVHPEAVQLSRLILHNAVTEIFDMNDHKRLVMPSYPDPPASFLHDPAFSMRLKSCNSSWDDVGKELTIKCSFE